MLKSSNQRLNLAVFGTMYNAAHFLTASHIHGAFVGAFCDPDQRNVAKALKTWEKTATRLETSGKPEDRNWAEHYRRMAKGEGVKIYSDILFRHSPALRRDVRGPWHRTYVASSRGSVHLDFEISRY